MKLIKTTLGALLLSVALAAQALAVPITGVINFAGGATLDNADLNLATKVVSWANPVAVTSKSGSFSGVTQVTLANDWTFNPGTAVANFWTGGGFTFNLASSSVTQSSSFINVEGIGSLTGNGYDETPGLWYFSTQGATGLTSISFSATTRSVPDGGTTALLLGIGLTGIALIARAKRKLV